mmetsp:Transcript_10115/g.18896  ORF Transcript_10115/g.18896 Transcript_10115/m.18896 type:complete len:227 (+) Transcript_10115:118-798(+)|eukprot:CAMPEP_0114428918 /NCGR_PEP_ID=MMETSP0103-20121206/9197_1 /TAXON_ID=37642 ORGANISM="Paraphysomonas imperforata, Strain PA2" /NCGR_SAMPLE_ID=MMETSP0103 /ASSEMBLY_ACC=CAM_ASM_000201 /LENGTH=226 /DNA_ID=CAMNT_0001598197 /DNA_START=63 /DNA_END=743 /DNA_ORIENTATION=-
MHRLFGKKKEVAPPPSLEDTSANIDTRVEALDKKIAGLNKELKVYQTQIAKAKGSTKQNLQRRAMDILKRKRMYEGQRDQLSGQQFNLDQTVFALETVKDSHTTIAAMQAASKQLKTEHAKIDIDKIEDMNDDLTDMFEDMNEVSEALGRNFGVPDDIDEDELDAELACLGDEFEEEFDEEVTNPSYMQESGMPHVPMTTPVTQQPQELTTDSKVDEFGLPVQNVA